MTFRVNWDHPHFFLHCMNWFHLILICWSQAHFNFSETSLGLVPIAPLLWFGHSIVTTYSSKSYNFAPGYTFKSACGPVIQRWKGNLTASFPKCTNSCHVWVQKSNGKIFTTDFLFHHYLHAGYFHNVCILGMGSYGRLGSLGSFQISFAFHISLTSSGAFTKTLEAWYSIKITFKISVKHNLQVKLK